MNTDVILLIVNIALSGGALAYGYGNLNARVKNNESKHQKHDAHAAELFGRLNALEQIAAKLMEAATRWERVMGNGINTKMAEYAHLIADLAQRIAVMEQHCHDMHDHDRRATDKKQA